MQLTENESCNRDRLRRTKPLVWEKVIRFQEQLASGKSAAIIQLQYSYACNFRCSHCSIAIFRKHAAKESRTLDIPTVKRVFDEADAYGLAQVGISGGEPTVFRDLKEVVEAIGPERFHIQLDTNGWRMTPTMAGIVKAMGVDKVQISIDGLDAKAHDSFRRKPGSYDRCISAIAACQKYELAVQVATVVDHARAQSDEFEDFLRFIHSLGAPVSVVYAKPVGEWQGRTDILCTPKDIARVKSLLKLYGGYDHTTPGYGMDLGCIAVKRMVSITAYGDVMPCPWMMLKLGNVFDEPLATILERGMKYFGEYNPKCRISEDLDFQKTVLPKLNRRHLPASVIEILPVPIPNSRWASVLGLASAVLLAPIALLLMFIVFPYEAIRFGICRLLNTHTGATNEPYSYHETA